MPKKSGWRFRKVPLWDHYFLLHVHTYMYVDGIKQSGVHLCFYSFVSDLDFSIFTENLRKLGGRQSIGAMYINIYI